MAATLTDWDELASEVELATQQDLHASDMPHWDPLRVLASLDRRREKRIAMVFPIRVYGFDGERAYFDEKSFTLDISARGCRFLLSRELAPGSVVALAAVNRLNGETSRVKALYEVAWTECGANGWEVGARLLDRKNIWGVALPAVRED
jgi:hypothetical protein